MIPFAHNRENYAENLRKQTRNESIRKRRSIAFNHSQCYISKEYESVLIEAGTNFDKMANDVFLLNFVGRKD